MAQGFFFSGEEGNLSGRKKLAEMMFRQGMTQQNSRHWMEDAANAAKGILGAYQMSKADREQARVDQEAQAGILASMARPDTVTGSTGEAATAAPAAAPASAPSRLASFSGGSQEFIQQMLPHAQRVSQQTGIDPRIVIAQAALESGWGRRAPGNNFFGIKSHGQPGGQTLATTEVVGGQPVRTRDSFRAYGSMGESADGYGQFLQQNPRYRPMLQARGLDAQIQALGASGYATDPNYAAKIRQIASGIQVPSAPAAPADALEGGSGMDEPPAPITSNTFPGSLPAPAMSPASAMAALPAMRSGAPSVDDMMAGQQVTQPMQAPMPVPRPEMAQAPMQAPMPQPRPNIEPPPGAQPASARQQIAGMIGLNERDRLMMLRDEQSLAPGEADTLRAGLGGQPQAAQAPAATPSANPIARLREMVMGGGSASPAAQTPATAQSQPVAPGDVRSRLLAAMMNPNVSQSVRQAAAMAYQSSDPDKREAARLANQAAALGIQSSQRQLAAPLPNSPEALAAQSRAREAEADRLGLTGAARQRYALTGTYEASPEAALRTRNEANAAEGRRLGLTGDRLQYYTIHGKLPENVGNLSAADKRAGREALDETPIVQNTLSTLERALALNDQAYSGVTAGIASRIGTSGIPGAGYIADPERAKASREFNQIMTGEAISAMSAALKGATTDVEMRQFIEILGNPGTPPEIRRRTIERMINVAKMKQAILQDRVQMLPENERRSFNALTAPPPGTPPASGGTPQVGAIVRGYRFKGGDPAKQENWERAQ